MKPRLNVIWNETYLIDLEISHIELEKLLPKSYLKENLKAIQLGYDINLYED